MNHSSQRLQHLDHLRRLLRDMTDARNESHRRLDALNVKLLLERDWKAVERADNLTRFCEVGVEDGSAGEGAVKEGLGKAGGLCEDDEGSSW